MTGVLKLIEKQRAMWDIRERLEDSSNRPGRFVENGMAYGPCLLISREYGAGGGELARLAGAQLGWNVYDREIVDQIADLAHARQKLVESVDEKIRTRWESTWRPVVDSEDLGCEAYLHYLHQVVMALAHHGDVVLLGRGAQFMLPSKCGLRVRLVAPFEARVKRMASLKEMPVKEAEVMVRQMDKERSAFVRKNFHVIPEDPLSYDLLINTGEIPQNQAVGIVLEALKDKLGVNIAPKLAGAAV